MTIMSDEELKQPEPIDIMEPRKATDVLLDIESKLDLLVKVLVSNDHTNKVLLNRVASLAQSVEKLTQSIVPSSAVPEERQSTGDVMIADDDDLYLQVEKEPKDVRRTARKETYVKKTTDRLTPVFQKVLEPSGKMIMMAEVEIFNDQKELVLKTRTTAKGSWQASLKPGQYTVDILKISSSSKKKMKYSGKIEIPESENPVELEQVKLES